MTEPASPPPPPEWEPPPPAPASRPRGFLRRNWLTIGACAVAVISLSIAIGVLANDSGGSTSAAATSSLTPSASPSAAASPTRGAAGANRAIRATILSESGTTWTVQTAKGETVDVAITSQTMFGTPKVAANASQFQVGSAVVITGTMDHGAATATRVVAARAKASGTPSDGASGNPSPTQSTTTS